MINTQCSNFNGLVWITRHEDVTISLFNYPRIYEPRSFISGTCRNVRAPSESLQNILVDRRDQQIIKIMQHSWGKILVKQICYKHWKYKKIQYMAISCYVQPSRAPYFSMQSGFIRNKLGMFSLRRINLNWILVHITYTS